MTEQTYLVLIRDGQLALAVGAALEERFAQDGVQGLALVPSVRGADFGGIGESSRDYLRQAGRNGTEPQIVALYEDGLLGMLESLGLCAYVGVPGDQDWRIMHWDGAGGAMLLPVVTARDLVDAVVDYTPWHDHATATPRAGRTARRPRLAPAGPLSRKLAFVAVAAPLLTVGLPIAAAAAQPAAAQAPAPPSTAAAAAIPAPGTAPAAVSNWWTSLNPVAQQQVVANASPAGLATLGSLNGVPSAVRDYANRQVLSNMLSTDPNQPGSVPNQISTLQGQISNLQSQLSNLPNMPASTANGKLAQSLQNQIDDANVQLGNLNTQLDSLNTLAGEIATGRPNVGVPLSSLDASNNAQAQVSAWWQGLTQDQKMQALAVPYPSSDPAAQPAAPGTPFLLNVSLNDPGNPSVGLYTVAINNPDTANRIATVVPGMNDNMTADQLPWYVNAARTLSSAADANSAQPGQVTSTIVWGNYPSPMGIFQASDTKPAQDAGPQLSSFLNGLLLTSNQADGPSMTTILYSYGSVVGSYAAASPGGLPSSSIVIVGSPGLPNQQNASQLLAPNPDGSPNVFAELATNDSIRGAIWTGKLGTNPASPQFGAQSADAGDGTAGSYIPNPFNYSGFGYSALAHADYFYASSLDFWGSANGVATATSNPGFWNMVHVINGQTDLVTPQGTAAISGLEQALAPSNWNGVPISWETGPTQQDGLTGTLMPQLGPPQTTLPAIVNELINGFPAPPAPTVSPKDPSWTPLPNQPWPGTNTPPQNQDVNAPPAQPAPAPAPAPGQAPAPSDPAAQPPASPGSSAINPDGTPVQGQPGTQSGPAPTQPTAPADPQPAPAAPEPAPATPQPAPADTQPAASPGSSAINPDGTPVQGQPGTQSGPTADSQPAAPAETPAAPADPAPAPAPALADPAPAPAPLPIIGGATTNPFGGTNPFPNPGSPVGINTIPAPPTDPLPTFTPPPVTLIGSGSTPGTNTGTDIGDPGLPAPITTASVPVLSFGGDGGSG